MSTSGEALLKPIFVKLNITLAIVAAFILGGLVGGKVVLDSPESSVGELINTTLGKPNDVDYSLFWDAHQLVREQFAGQLDEKAYLYGAIRGAVDALGDRFSLFLDPDEADRFFEEINGEFSGIGAEINQEGDRFIIVAPLPGTPAEAAGLKAQDVIVRVDDVEAATLKLGELINSIRGPEGTEVRLTIDRAGLPEPKEITLTRATIQVPSLEFARRDDGIAVLQLIQFSDDTMSELREIESQVLDPATKGLILDLRNNPGGLLDVSIDVGSLLLEDGPIVLEENKEGVRKKYPRTLEATWGKVPLVVLVNGGSASASEIVAGAIQDRDRGRLVGVQTFGKGSVQTVEDLEDGSALRLTVAKWLTPDGRAINGTGITPDEVIEDNEDTEEDEQLERAIELLTQE